MPFVYYGGKKALARYYPPPAYATIIEPFAGSAGYALHWATANHKVILVEKDPAVAALWRRLQAPDAVEDLLAVSCPTEGTRVVDPLLATSDDPLIALTAGGGGGFKAAMAQPFAPFIAGESGSMQTGLAGRPFQVTSRMARDWPAHRNRIVRAIPRIRDWQIIEGDYTDAPNVPATWFIDPPYWTPPERAGRNGDIYRFGAGLIDYDTLAAWCRSRPGQAIVCEQYGATWLPFRPLRRMTTAAGDGGKRIEVIWSKTPGKVRSTPASKTQTDQAAVRRTKRIRGH